MECGALWECGRIRSFLCPKWEKCYTASDVPSIFITRSATYSRSPVMPATHVFFAYQRIRSSHYLPCWFGTAAQFPGSDSHVSAQRSVGCSIPLPGHLSGLVDSLPPSEKSTHRIGVFEFYLQRQRGSWPWKHLTTRQVEAGPLVIRGLFKLAYMALPAQFKPTCDFLYFNQKDSTIIS